jgi:alpha-1,3-glucosyltransferase
MRASVLISEFLVYIPAVFIAVRWISRLDHVNLWETAIALTAILMQPATILIDHGHFQYNTVMLGFAVATMSSILAGRRRWACVFFVAALGFKQMALFYAPVVFAYLLGACISPTIRPFRLITIALTTLLSFALLYAPLLLGAFQEHRQGITITEYNKPPLLDLLPFEIDPKNALHAPLIQLAQSIHRIFPFARGLFEDKVANLWCAIHTFHKLHQYPIPLVQRAALVATLASIIPPCLIVLCKPKKDLVPLAFATTSWGFFLCSYQVHEKNVLLPLLPMTLLLASKTGLLPNIRAWVGFANILATWTLFPLLKRDGLRVPYFVLTFLWAYLMGLPPTSLSAYWSAPKKESAGRLAALLHAPFYIAMLTWHIVEAFYLPPKDKPDLWVVANVLVGAAGFGLCYLWCLVSLIQKAGWMPQFLSVQEKVKTQ